MILITGDKGYLGKVLAGILDNYRGYDIKDGYDIIDTVALSEALKDVEFVIHLAAMVGEGPCSEDPTKAFIVNGLGTCLLAKLCVRRGIEMIMASTCSIYGDLKGKYGYKPNPWGVYTFSKYIGETCVTALGYHVLRFGSLYGGEFSNSLPQVFKRDAEKGEVVVRDSDSWRPLTHVEDAARALLFLRAHQRQLVFDVVGENIRKGDLANLIARRYNAKVTFQDEKGRSYRASSKLLLDKGFRFNWNIKKWLDQI